MWKKNTILGREGSGRAPKKKKSECWSLFHVPPPPCRLLLVPLAAPLTDELKATIIKYWEMRLTDKDIIERLLDKHIDKNTYGLG